MRLTHLAAARQAGRGAIPRPAVVSLQVAAAMRDGASGAAAVTVVATALVTEQVTAAIEGDLIGANTALSDKFTDLEARLDALEP